MNMALLHVNFFSNVLGLASSMDVILPQSAGRQIGMQSVNTSKYPTLYLLHGLSDDQTAWQRYTSIERYAMEFRYAVVMPTTFRFAYTDSPAGKYYTYLAEELPTICHDFFPRMSSDPKENFVAGLSMGGYGAFKLALRCPQTFGAAASLSGALTWGSQAHTDPELRFIFGDDPRGSENDVLELMRRRAIQNEQIPLYQWCGTEDYLLEENEKVHALANALHWNDYTYKTSSGDHDWRAWDAQIRSVLEWMHAHLQAE